MTCVCYSSSRLLYNRNDGIDRDSCKYKEEKIYFHNYKHFYRQDQEEYLFNITDTIPVRNILQRKCCFVHNKCSDRNVTECENAKGIQRLLTRLQGSHSTWKTWKNEGIPGKIMEFCHFRKVETLKIICIISNDHDITLFLLT